MFIAELADRKIPPAHLVGALRFSKWSSDSEYEQGVLAHIEAMEAAIGISSTKNLRPMPTQYSLDLLNMDSKYPIDKIIERIKTTPAATLCFYGAPGTGKTALAEHITKATGKPLLVKKASDIISKWVGETEQNMAAMFEEAALEGAVLLLDEADTFLTSRSMATHGWERSQVNEMLQQMERFKGVFICTTNLIDNLNEAVLRRFTFKVNFKPLLQKQRVEMFKKENGLTDLPLEFERRLEKLQHLTVGDFATVKRQAGFIGDHPTPEEFLTLLEEEHKIKPNVKFDKRVGFA
jgi:SpoVK/Ycf46/Vps4 family AAA+-type ATPase